MEKIIKLARKLRKNQTDQEYKLWTLLRNRQLNNLKFRRQVPIEKYIADFMCEEKKLIIEIDGGQHNSPCNIKEDEERTKYFESLGYRVVRFWNNEIDNNIEGVYLKLLEIAK